MPEPEAEMILSPQGLERLMAISFNRAVTKDELKKHLRAVIRECQRLQGAEMIRNATR